MLKIIFVALVAALSFSAFAFGPVRASKAPVKAAKVSCCNGGSCCAAGSCCGR